MNTDAVGGIDVYNPWATEQNPGIRFEEGQIHLEGERALVYVRERYPLPNGDLDRAYRQRTVVKEIIRKIMTPTTLANPVTFSDVVGQLADTMTVARAAGDRSPANRQAVSRAALRARPIAAIARSASQASSLISRDTVGSDATRP